AELAGIGMNSDAYHLVAPDPTGKGALQVMDLALKDANTDVSEVDYINAHGTSTPLGDIAETLAITELFGKNAYNLNISSTKSMTGHALGGAGSMEAVLTILAMKNNVIPPTINHSENDKDPKIDYNLNFTFNVKQDREVRCAISNSFGFGGHNACLVFKKVK
ncbi:MAG: beta-ketoacyl-[Paludibacteraceae bacterium]|nr:beta-ketoacyl-[acyl-carrier-protein] synthase II [Paludibacteraceae bacterium]